MDFEIPKKWSSHINDGDLESVLSLYEDNALLMATFDAQPLSQPSHRRKYFENFLARKGAGVDVDESSLYCIRLSQNIYQATGLYTFFYEENNEVVRHKSRYTFIVSDEDSSLILHHHSSLVPSPTSE